MAVHGRLEDSHQQAFEMLFQNNFCYLIYLSRVDGHDSSCSPLAQVTHVAHNALQEQEALASYLRIHRDHARIDANCAWVMSILDIELSLSNPAGMVHQPTARRM